MGVCGEMREGTEVGGSGLVGDGCRIQLGVGSGLGFGRRENLGEVPGGTREYSNDE